MDGKAKSRAMARAAGILFFVSTASYLIGDGLLGTILNRVPSGLAGQGERDRMLLGFFLELVNAASVAGIAIFLYPILKKHNEALAVGYFGFRLLESVLLLVSAAAPILLLGMNGGAVGGSTGASGSGTASGELASLLAQGYSLFFQLGMVVLGIGSFLLCAALYRYRLVPRLLAGFGFIGYAALLTSSCLSLTGQEVSPLLFAPGAVFEIAFPLWLMIKGLNAQEKPPQSKESARDSLTA